MLLVDACIGKRIVNRTPERLFVVLLEVALVTTDLHLPDVSGRSPVNPGGENLWLDAVERTCVDCSDAQQ